MDPLGMVSVVSKFGEERHPTYSHEVKFTCDEDCSVDIAHGGCETRVVVSYGSASGR